MKCKFCKKEIDETLFAPNPERKVLNWHWSCFQYLAMNGILKTYSPEGEDVTALILAREFEEDEK